MAKKKRRTRYTIVCRPPPPDKCAAEIVTLAQHPLPFNAPQETFVRARSAVDHDRRQPTLRRPTGRAVVDAAIRGCARPVLPMRRHGSTGPIRRAPQRGHRDTVAKNGFKLGRCSTAMRRASSNNSSARASSPCCARARPRCIVGKKSESVSSLDWEPYTAIASSSSPTDVAGSPSAMCARARCVRTAGIPGRLGPLRLAADRDGSRQPDAGLRRVVVHIELEHAQTVAGVRDARVVVAKVLVAQAQRQLIMLPR